MKKSSRLKFKRPVVLLLILAVIVAGYLLFRNNVPRQVINTVQSIGQPTTVPIGDIVVNHANGTRNKYSVIPPVTVFTFVKNGGSAALLTVNTQQVEIASDDRVCVSSFVIPAPFSTRGEVEGDKRCFTVADAQ